MLLQNIVSGQGNTPLVQTDCLNNPHQGVILAFKPLPSDNGTRQITATYCATWILRSEIPHADSLSL